MSSKPDFVAPADARRAEIARLAEGAQPQFSVLWRGGHVRVPVVAAQIASLVYRLENGRLIAQLREQLGTDGAAAMLERSDGVGTQGVLHDLLVEMAGRAAGPILQEMARLAIQTEPLLATADGVIVNGNRRLAAMRELLSRDPVRYAAFRIVSIAVLPPEATPQDLEAIEAALQMAPETKLAYGWINRRLKLRRQRDELGIPVADICEASRLEGEPQLDREIGELALAEAYLHYLGEPGRYSLVATASPLFIGLHERLKHLPPELAELWRLAGFAIIRGRAWSSVVIDRQFPFAPPIPDHLPVWALVRFGDEMEQAPIAKTSDAEAASIDPERRRKLVEALSNPDRGPELGPALASLIERLRVEHQEKNNPYRLVRLIEKLRHTLKAVAPHQLSEQQRKHLRAELAALRAQAEALLGTIEPE